MAFEMNEIVERQRNRIKNILSKPSLKVETRNIIENRFRENSLLDKSPVEELKETAIRSQIGFEEAFFNTGDDLQEIITEVAKTNNIDLMR